jgi:hypothetical protein
MGTLKPNTKYIYERANGITYAREFGAGPHTRVPVGWDWEVSKRQDDELWENIRNLARTNETLQSELDRVIMLYNLIKDDDPPDYHPV